MLAGRYKGRVSALSKGSFVSVSLRRHSCNVTGLHLPPIARRECFSPLVIEEMLADTHLPSFSEITNKFKDTNTFDLEKSRESGDIPNDVTSEDFEKVFQEKIDICMYVFDHNSNQESDREKKKTQYSALSAIMSLYTDGFSSRKMTPEQHKKVIEVIELHLLHCYPPFENRLFFGEEQIGVNFKDFSFFDIIYELLPRLFTVPLAKPFFLNKWYKRLLNTLNSPDVRERDSAGKCLVQYYVGFESQRDLFIEDCCKMIGSVLSDNATPYCIKPLLGVLVKVFGTMPNNIPKKWQQLVCDHVVPIVRSSYLTSFVMNYRRLIEIMMVADKTIPRLLFLYFHKYWPYSLLLKQSWVLELMNLTIENMTLTDFQVVVMKVASFYKQCVFSESLRVCQGAIKIWLNPKIVPKLESKSQRVIPVMKPALMKVAKYHWHADTREEADRALDVMDRVDPMTARDCDGHDETHRIDRQKMTKWIFIAKSAEAYDHGHFESRREKIEEEFRRKPIVHCEMRRDKVHFAAPVGSAHARSIKRLSVPKVNPPAMLRRLTV